MITTKTGDKGQTTCGGERVDKDSVLVKALGAIDELQSILELIKAEDLVINDLSQIMAQLGGGLEFKNCDFRVEEMEEKIKGSNLKKLDGFVRFKNKKALELNWARAVCRRVERKIISLNRIKPVSEVVLKYFNRLSDYLFLLALEQI